MLLAAGQLVYSGFIRAFLQVPTVGNGPDESAEREPREKLGHSELNPMQLDNFWSHHLVAITGTSGHSFLLWWCLLLCFHCIHK